MVQTIRPEEITDTELTELAAEPIITNQTERSLRVTRRAIPTEKIIRPGIHEYFTASSVQDNAEFEWSGLVPEEPPRNGDFEKNEHARANALMDAGCLHYLRLFIKKQYYSADELSEHMKQTSDWIKIAILVRADYLQALDSTVRITPQGISAWERISQLKKMSHSGT